MFNILVLNNIAQCGLDRFPSDGYTLDDVSTEPDAIVLRSQKIHDLTINNNLLAVGRAGAGVNNIPVDVLSQHGIPVFNTPGANANAVKELVIAGMLLASRNLCQAWQYVRDIKGDNSELNQQVEKGKKQFVGFELPGRTLGVIGLGAIGVKVANAAQALGMKVIGYDPSITVQRAWELTAEVKEARSIEELMRESDFVSLHVPLVESTKGLLNQERLALLKKNSTVLNFSRDGIIDEEAIFNVLENDKCHAYVCDFPSPRLKDHVRVICLPHLGASTREAEENCAVMLADQLRDYLENGNIKHSVNFPEMKLPRNGETRIAIANTNIPNMVGQISSILGEADVNIVDMLNKSRGDVAYTLLDVNSAIDEKILNKLAAIEGVLKARIL